MSRISVERVEVSVDDACDSASEADVEMPRGEDVNDFDIGWIVRGGQGSSFGSVRERRGRDKEESCGMSGRECHECSCGKKRDEAANRMPGIKQLGARDGAWWRG